MRSRTPAPSEVHVPVRVLAGVSVPDTSLVSRAIDYAHEHCEPYLFNHVMRSWLYAAGLAPGYKAPSTVDYLLNAPFSE